VGRFFGPLYDGLRRRSNFLEVNFVNDRTAELSLTLRESSVSQWYAVHVRSNQEESVAARLLVKGLQTYVPCYRETRQWSDRVKESDRPLFPGYVFCQTGPIGFSVIRKCPGVVQIVGAGNRPLAVEEREIEAIQRLALSGTHRQPCAYATVGERVQIVGGPLSGLVGILMEPGDSGRRLVVSVSLLQRSVSVELKDIWGVVRAHRA
jgi:transcription antitermination factor NusG